MNEILCRQMAIDYCCSPEDVLDHQNHFAEHSFLPGRRRFQEGRECFLKIAVINGKLLFAGNAGILSWCRENYESIGSEWFFEPKNLRRLNDRLHQDGYQIETAHPFFLSDRMTEVSSDGFAIRRYVGAEIEQFRGDGRFAEAFAFCPDAPDEIGLAAFRDGEILGMAGASSDSPAMWQIGINVSPHAGNAGIGRMLVTLLKNELLQKGILPYYGTSMSHIVSQRVALSAGFVPAWAELAASKMDT